MSEQIIYIDRSEIREGKLEEVRAAIHGLVEFVETQEPQLIGYALYFNEEATGITVVAIHPDSASLQFHLEIGGPVFRKFIGFIKLQTIEVYGRPSEKVLEQLQQKAAMLGEAASVVVHEQHAGFMRLASAIT